MHDTMGWEWEAEWSANRSFMVWENRAQVFPVGADKLCPAHQGAGTHAEKKVAGRAEAVTRGSVTGTHFHWKLIYMQSTIVNQTLNIAFHSKIYYV